jgi:phage/plasmid-like protein (TIGR03299 family)
MYQPCQPAELFAWFERYISVDDRFHLDVAGSLEGGKRIWATALYRDPLEIAGDKHTARLLMSTTFDASGATINQGTMTRVVCENTLRAAHADGRAVIRTRHNTKFDAARVGKELAAVAQGFAEYKKVGDAMAQVEMSKAQVSDFFKACLDIPSDAKRDDISSRKANQFSQLAQAFGVTKKEGAGDTAWAALNAITRYVDHDRGGAKEESKAFSSAQFGSGDALKGKAMGLLMPLIRDKVLVAA